MSNHDDIPFVFAGAELDRLALRRADAAWLENAVASPDTLFVPVLGEDSVLDSNGAPLLLDGIAVQPLLAQAQCTVLLGRHGKHNCFALGLAQDVPLPVQGAICTNLRPQFDLLDHGALALLGYARAMVHWQNHNRYCGKCGAPTQNHRAGHELHCARCGTILYPRVNPAIIVLVTHEERCLLGRQASGNRYSTLAGFVEPGETPESTLHREVQEETNIRIATLRYVSSQPWPYPASLMLGFRATAENTDIHCNDGELLDARWFSRADIIEGLHSGKLSLSAPKSISYALLRGWFDEAGTSLDALRS